MSIDKSQMAERSHVGAVVSPSEGLTWKCHTKVEKYAAGIDDVYAGRVQPYAVEEVEGNLLTYGGADILWAGLIGNVTATSGQGYTKFDNGNAAIGVGISTAAAAATQTGLQAASSRRYHKGMDATYPTHTTGTAASTSSKIVFKATFSTAQANHAWNEWCIRNSTLSSGAGRMLNRKVTALGTKSSAATWAMTVTLSLA